MKNISANLELFESWLHKGLGRAVVFLAHNHGSSYRKAVVHACLHNITYDSQCEEGRGEYLWTLIEHSGDRKLFRDVVLEHLRPPPHETQEYDWPQIFHVAQQFATKGDSEMRQAMYSAFDLLGFNAAGVSSATSLISLDAWEGFVFAVHRFGGSDTAGHWWMIGSLITDLEERVGKEEAERLIVSAIGIDTPLEKAITAYRRYEEERRQANERTDSERIDLQALTDMPGDRSWASRFRRWVLKASPEELYTATHRFLLDQNPEKVWGCLRVFARRPFPGDLSRMLELSDSDHERVMRAAVVALSRISDPQVRARALRLLRVDGRFADGIKLLESSYKESDLRIFEEVGSQSLTADEIHRIGMTVRHIVTNCVRPEMEQVLLFLYEAGPCSLCRRGFVEALIELERLPDSIREECRFDAEPDTRRAVCSTVPR